MQRRQLITASVLATGTGLAAHTRARAGGALTMTGSAKEISMADTSSRSGYAPVNGLDLYYEVHGEGDPLVLIHGAFGTIDTWGPILETLASSRTVIAVELQGHGHTADIDRPFGYTDFADDVAAAMAHLEIPTADVVGYSMGANTAIQVAIRHPERVHRLVAISPNVRSDGEYADVHAGIEALTADMLAGSPIEEAYRRSAPAPDEFPTLIEKLKSLLTAEFAFSEDSISAIAAPTFVAIGDSDTVRPEHAVELFRMLGGGVPGDMVGLPSSRLAVLPSTTHATIVSDSADLLLSMIDDFLDAADSAPA